MRATGRSIAGAKPRPAAVPRILPNSVGSATANTISQLGCSCSSFTWAVKSWSPSLEARHRHELEAQLVGGELQALETCLAVDVVLDDGGTPSYPAPPPSFIM